jgi:hypothetical protein
MEQCFWYGSFSTPTFALPNPQLVFHFISYILTYLFFFSNRRSYVGPGPHLSHLDLFADRTQGLRIQRDGGSTTFLLEKNPLDPSAQDPPPGSLYSTSQ